MDFQERIVLANKEFNEVLVKYDLLLNVSLRYTPQAVIPFVQFVDKPMDNISTAPSDSGSESSEAVQIEPTSEVVTSEPSAPVVSENV